MADAPCQPRRAPELAYPPQPLAAYACLCYHRPDQWTKRPVGGRGSLCMYAVPPGRLPGYSRQTRHCKLTECEPMDTGVLLGTSWRGRPVQHAARGSDPALRRLTTSTQGPCAAAASWMRVPCPAHRRTSLLRRMLPTEPLGSRGGHKLLDPPPDPISVAASRPVTPQGHRPLSADAACMRIASSRL